MRAGLATEVRPMGVSEKGERLLADWLKMYMGGNQKIGVYTPKWMVKIMEKPYEHIADFGGNYHHFRKHPS